MVHLALSMAMGQPFDPSRANASGWQPGADPVGFGPGTPADYTQPNAPVPPDRPSPYAPSAAPPPTPRRPWGPALIGLAAGLVIAVAVAAVLVATDVINFGSAEAASVSSASITLPAELGGFPDLIAANKALLADSSMSESRKASTLAAQQSNQDTVTKLTVSSYQAANPGAAVAYRAYADPKLLHVAGVIAVRASYPGLTMGPVDDPAYLGLAVPRTQVKTFGDVQCLVVQQQLTRAGSPVDPANDVTTMCQRTATALTVQVYGSSFDGAADQQTLIALTSAAWASVSA